MPKPKQRRVWILKWWPAIARDLGVDVDSEESRHTFYRATFARSPRWRALIAGGGAPRFSQFNQDDIDELKRAYLVATGASVDAAMGQLDPDRPQGERWKRIWFRCQQVIQELTEEQLYPDVGAALAVIRADRFGGRTPDEMRAPELREYLVTLSARRNLHRRKRRVMKAKTI